MENTKNSSLAKLFPVMLCFFAMGFVDLVGIASNYVKADLNLTDSQANIFPSLVFFWFLIFSVPTGMLMNRIGRKKTVLLSLVITFASLLLPVFGDGYVLMLLSFSLLGIGNALMQTSLNPLLSNIVSGERLASTLTFGQFVKAIASFLAPYIAMWGATQAIPSLGMGWRVLFPVYMVIAVIAILWLSGTSIREEKEEGRPSTYGECLALLGKPFIFLCFLGIMCHVGIDVGTNTTAPKILMERLGMTLADEYDMDIQNHPSVTYKAKGDDWYVISYLENDRIYYKKCFINGEYWNTWYFDYPSWLADSYNNKCAVIESTFTPGWKSGRALY